MTTFSERSIGHSPDRQIPTFGFLVGFLSGALLGLSVVALI
ncbi:MAG: hypothetical protein ACR2PG_00345 [Hyphomicrobiaceae bacterium]